MFTPRYPAAGYPLPVATKKKYFLFTVEDGKRLPRIAMRSWTFVVTVGLLLTLLSIIDRGGLSTASGPCEFTVNTPQLNVRAEPSAAAPQVQTLGQGARITATNIVTAGFRKVSDGHWALDGYLTPVAGSTCV